MIQQFKLHRLVLAMTVAGVMSVSSNVQASAFQLYEQDAASIGNYHAGYAAIAEDASTAYYNPAGLVRLQNQELILGVDPVLTNFKFTGTVNNHALPTYGAQPVSAQGGNTNFVPFGHYAAPITKNLVFGLSVVAPFGLETNYGQETFARYAATKTFLDVLDVSPSLGFALNDKISVGAGLDIEHAEAEFDLIGGIAMPSYDSTSNNNGKDTAYGFHLGALYQVTDATRIGISYHSQVVHHLHGDSNFSGPLANFNYPVSLLSPANGFQESTQLKANLTLPPSTALSLFHTFNPTWDVMGSIVYTQWSVLNQIVLRNVAGASSLAASNSITVVIPEGYRNSWNYTVGANYHLNPQFTFRGGLGYDETPSSDKYRNLQLPDSDRIVLALGGHYQATKTIGFDVGWTHFFAMNTRINNLSQAVGDQVTTTNGSVKANADVYGVQVKWDIV